MRSIVDLPLRPADDTSLHFLDDAAVLFSDRRQELYLLNETAAFVWSCLEEGLTGAELLAAYTRSFGITAALAQVHIEQVFREYEDLGLLADRCGRKIPVCQTESHTFRPNGREPAAGIGRLDVTESSPRLGGRSDDRQNEQLVDAAPVFVNGRLEIRQPHSERWYRLLSTCFRVRYTTPDQERRVHPVLAHLEVPKPGTAGLAIVMISCTEGQLLLVNDERKGQCSSLVELAPLVKDILLAEAINNYEYLLCIHAGVVRNAVGCLLLPGTKGSGKTTLTAALLRSGFRYFSDEVALLEKETHHIKPVPISLCVKNSAWNLLIPYYPHLGSLAVHHRNDQKIVRYLNPPPDVQEPESEASHPITWIVFPRYSPNADTVLWPLKRTEALRRLLAECLVVPAPLNRTRIEQLVRWISSVRCFELPMCSLAKAADLVAQLCNEGASVTIDPAADQKQQEFSGEDG
jgi:hypothetical protein